MTVPAVARAVEIYTGLASRLPLTGVEWLEVSTPPVTPQLRKARIVQDLFFHNMSLVTVLRDEDGYVSDYAHLPMSLWSIDSEGFILVNGEKVDQDSVVFIPGLLPMGFLEFARDSIRQYRGITQTINNRSVVGQPYTIIKETQANLPQTPEEIDESIDGIIATIQNRAGGIIYQPYGIEIEAFGATDEANANLIQAREAIRKDVANFSGIASALLDGSSGDTTMTYQNALDQQNELAELSLKTFTEPLADRLSMDDVTPPGVKVTYDYSMFNVPTAKGNGPADTPALGGPNA